MSAMRYDLPSETTTRRGESVVNGLAGFFPAASPVRIAVRLTRVNEIEPAQEGTMVEFGTAREIFFASTLPLEFGEKLRVRNSDGSLDVEVQVVAVQYHERQMAVAGRFIGEVSNWILKP